MDAHRLAAIVAAVDHGSIRRCGGLGCERIATRGTDSERSTYDRACDDHSDGNEWHDLPHAADFRDALAHARSA